MRDPDIEKRNEPFMATMREARSRPLTSDEVVEVACYVDDLHALVRGGARAARELEAIKAEVPPPGQTVIRFDDPETPMLHMLQRAAEEGCGLMLPDRTVLSAEQVVAQLTPAQLLDLLRGGRVAKARAAQAEARLAALKEKLAVLGSQPSRFSEGDVSEAVKAGRGLSS